LFIICFTILPLLAARAILDIGYTVIIHSISGYSHCLVRLFLMILFHVFFLFELSLLQSLQPRIDGFKILYNYILYVF
ncbi:hypothetical protein CABS01_16524, partial [Colletotrichum abscissum]|uniref:uncharacterized protein n=1 Tax=Colletotrichum abscissum TaxID=1671311 RepID=UPI0027D5EB8E